MENEWSDFFGSIKEKAYFSSLNAFLDSEYKTGVVFPNRANLFNAFELTPCGSVKAVILGQDPYHEPGQAMGLSFSVPNGVPLPPSLRNIYREIQNDLCIEMDFSNGDLTYLATQGVFLLNAYLSVRSGEPLSHKRPEYDCLISDVFDYLDNLDQPIAFLLWGSFAKKFSAKVKNPKHCVLSAAHPSPLSANRGGWFDQHLFSKCNNFLVENGVSPIDWKNQ